MPISRSLILKKNIIGAELPYLIKLSREESKLHIFRKRHNETLYEETAIWGPFDPVSYVVFEKELSFPCIFGGEATPTPEGIFHIETRSAKEYISSYYPNHDQVKFFGYLVVFEDYFIHSDLYAADETAPDAGKAISRADKTTSGCIRISQENLSWLIEHIDVGTLVFL